MPTMTSAKQSWQRAPCASRVGTLNMGGLGGKLTLVERLITDHDVDILCIQETNVSPSEVMSAKRWFEKKGYYFEHSDCDAKRNGGAVRGVATIAKSVLHKDIPAKGWEKRNWSRGWTGLALGPPQS